jgi:hypothetical protein
MMFDRPPKAHQLAIWVNDSKLSQGDTARAVLPLANQGTPR